MAITFDKINKHIIIEAPDTSVTIQALLNSIREYESELINLGLCCIASASGKNPLGGTDYVGITMALMDGWLPKFEDRAGPDIVPCKIYGGNLLAYDENNVLRDVPVAESDYVFVTYGTSTAPSYTDLSDIMSSIWDELITAQRVSGGFGQKIIDALKLKRTIK